MIELVGKYGVKSWSLIATYLTGRLGKQCRERWYNHLSPVISKVPWSLEEDRVIVEVTYTTTALYSFTPTIPMHTLHIFLPHIPLLIYTLTAPRPAR